MGNCRLRVQTWRTVSGICVDRPSRNRPLAYTRFWPIAGIYDRQLYGRSDDKRCAAQSACDCVGQPVALLAYDTLIGRFGRAAF